MSQESREELVRQWLDRWNAGEREIDPQILHHDLVFHSALTNTTYHGHDGLRRWIAEIDDQFEHWHSAVDDFRDAAEDRLLALGTVHLRGRASGVEFDQPMAWLLTFAGDQIVEVTTIPDHAQALEAVGLSDGTMTRENVEIVRQLYAEWARGDFSNQEPFSKDLDIEMSGWLLFQSDPVKARGVDGLAAVWRDVLTGWDDFHSGPIEELTEEGDQIVVINRLVARGRQSGIEIDARRGAVFTFRGGKIARLHLTGDDEALEVVGLRE